MEAWDDITSQFNNSENVHHVTDVKQIKKMWQNMKAKARDAKTVQSLCKRTGGGPPPPEMGPLDSQVIAIMPHIMPTIQVPIDSDTIEGELTAGEDDDSSFWQPKRARQETGPDSMSEKVLDAPSLLVEIPIDEPGPSGKRSQGQKRKYFEDLKIELLEQELKQNKEKFDLQINFLREKQKIEIEFTKKRQNLELEILEIRKKKELEK